MNFFLSCLRRWAPGIGLLWILYGCSSAATVPAPIAETPSLQFPESVAIGVGTTQAGPGASIKLSIDPVGPFFEEIVFGSGIVFLGNTITTAVLGPLSAFRIPSAVDFTDCSTAINEEGTLKTLSIDFAKYDFDGDGNLDCSGNTAVLPICYRVWVGNERRIAGIFEQQIPTSSQTGAGRFIADSVDLGTAKITRVRANYDFVDPLDLLNEVFLPSDDSGDETLDGPVAHTVARQEGSAATSKKTVNFSLGPLVNGVTQWREGSDFWLGTINEFVDVSPDFESLDNQCATISTQEAAPNPSCTSVGLNLAGLEFPSVGSLADLEFPADFPLTPNFLNLESRDCSGVGQ